jgi:cation:H+ antiporter
MERSWIGVILLALVTSLPEVATSATAALIDLPDIVFGNVFGSNLFNVLIIAILDIISPHPPLLDKASRNNLLPSSFGIKMMALALLPLVLYNIPGLNLSPIKLFDVIDISSLLMILVYILGMRSIFVQENEFGTEEPKQVFQKMYGGISRRRVNLMFTFYAVIIIGAGIGMSVLADRISEYEIPLGDGYLIGQSLVGVILLALVTSLPELMVSYGAVRLGAIDMAVGNILGSNMFNMLIIGISDFFYSAGSILNRPTVADSARITGIGSHLLVGLAGIIMLSIVASKLAYRRKSNNRVSRSSYALFALFILTYLLLFYINFS